MKSFTITIQQKVKVVQSIATAMKVAVNVTLRHENVKPPAGVTILLTHDDHLQQFNRDYRGIDAPTDVLSFAADKLLPEIEDEENYLGDIAISIPYAQRQAKKEGHSLKAELQLLVVHGTLHLLGYDHETPQDKQRMWWVQNSILAQLGAEITSPEE